MITTFFAYILIASYFVMERWLRKGQDALSLQPTTSDGGSSRLIWTSGLFNLILVLLAPILNLYEVGNWNHSSVGWIGILIMSGGIVLRYWAAQTLGRFYTRTLRILKEHQIIDRGLYRIIRHPGYLGTFMMILGAGLAVNNWIVVLGITTTGILSRAYRIHVEEQMLDIAFGEEYKAYRDKTWGLIPFIY